MSAEQMTLTVLATNFAQAIAKDQTSEAGGCDLSAGLFGPHVSSWIRDLAATLTASPKENVSIEMRQLTEQARKDIAYLLEAYDYGQFADDMLDHASPSCRSPCKPLREALRRHLDWLQSSKGGSPIDMILHCPRCHLQRVDAPKSCDMGVGCDEVGRCYAVAMGQPERCTKWNNPPHRSHLCACCGYIWRPSDVPTNGVVAINTKGKDDSPRTDL